MKPLILLGLPLLISGLLAADPAPTVRFAVPLWPNGAPGSEAKKDLPEKEEIATNIAPHRIVYNIHNPSLTAYLPPFHNDTGAAVIIAPGGSDEYLSIDNEGTEVAKWLSDSGVAGFVLKYRLERDKAGGSTYKSDVESLADALRAVRLVRSRAAEWKLNPARIGFIGFSAGGKLAARVGWHGGAGDPAAPDPIDRLSSRPDFLGLLYPGNEAAKWPVTKDAPPTFMCCAYDDAHASQTIAALLVKFRAAGAPAEVHVFNSGAHGFGMRHRVNPVSQWPVLFQEWLGDLGMLK